MTGMDFKRQKQFFNPIKQTSHITVIGAGSIGSFISLTLAKLGFNQITVFDGDIVEEHNLPNQFYRITDVNKPKVEALQEIVHQFTGTTITCHNKFVENVMEQIQVEQDMIIIFALDSLDVRKKLALQLEMYPAVIVDPRMGGEGWSIFVTHIEDETEYKEYLQTLNGTPSKLPCGAQSIIYTILNVSSEVARIVKQLEKKEPTKNIIKREMNNYLFINK